MEASDKLGSPAEPKCGSVSYASAKHLVDNSCLCRANVSTWKCPFGLYCLSIVVLGLHSARYLGKSTPCKGKMYAMCLKLRPTEGETCRCFVRRRNKAAKKLLDETGYWSKRWFAKAVQWYAHLRRDLAQQRLHVEQGVNAALVSTCFSWGPPLLAFQDEHFINQRRIVTRRDSVSDRVAVRTNLRKGQRRVHARWSTSLSKLKARA